MIKKIWALLLAFIMVISFAACSGGEGKKVELTEDEQYDLMAVIEDREYIDQIGKSFVSAELSNQEALNLVLDEYLGPYSGLYGIEFSYINDSAIDLYGIEVTPEDVVCRSCGEVRAVYHDDGKFRIPASHKHRFEEDVAHVLPDVIESYKNEAGDEYTVKMYKMFSDIGKYSKGDAYGYNLYNTYNDAAAMENMVFFAATDVEMQELYAGLEAKDKQVYIYKFGVNEGGNYFIKSYEIA